jgi:hypothetical protein
MTIKVGDRVIAVRDIKGLVDKESIVALKHFTGTVEKDTKTVFPNKPTRLIVRFCDGQCVPCKPEDLMLLSK